MRDRWGPIAVAALAVLAVGIWAAVFTTWQDQPSAASAPSARPSSPASSPSPSPSPSREWTLVLGDSMATPAGAERAWPKLVAERLDLPQVMNLARGSVGYEASSGEVECGNSFCPDLAGQLTAAPDDGVSVVLVSAGRFDLDSSPPLVSTAIESFFRQLARKYPDASIIATSPLWDDDFPSSELAAIAEQVSDAVSAVGGTYVDLGQPLSGRADLMSSDGIHPNDAGHAAIASAVVAELPRRAL